ncbi:hypothetical protein JL720_13631 [Aureococcus anophagefferens]|nr:hypothetical protein JL720_13631 [Aureococcus anophagefferens]
MTGGHQRMALAFAIAASALARPVCRDEHAECANWARLGECDANPNYMHESCAPACGTCGSRVDALGFTVDLWAEEMNGHDRDTFANNARINRDQPPTVPAFTDVGFAVRPIPRDVHAAPSPRRQDPGPRRDAHAVVMKPGEMVLESSKSIHGRLVPLNGASYDNIFVHFRPRLGWDRFTGVPNGAVLSDHIEL